MLNTALFVTNYSEQDKPQIIFAWNGKHSTEFEDKNQDFRWSVINYCMSNPDLGSPLLLADLFLADAEWSKEAWCAPRHFAALGSLLLERGKTNAVIPFSNGFTSSFDTFGACHAMTISPELLSKLSSDIRIELVNPHEEAVTQRLTSVQELFTKLAAGTASKGWVTLAPGTPVSDVRVVWPRWYHKLWIKLKALLIRERSN